MIQVATIMVGLLGVLVVFCCQLYINWANTPASFEDQDCSTYWKITCTYKSGKTKVFYSIGDAYQLYNQDGSEAELEDTIAYINACEKRNAATLAAYRAKLFGQEPK